MSPNERLSCSGIVFSAQAISAGIAIFICFDVY